MLQLLSHIFLVFKQSTLPLTSGEASEGMPLLLTVPLCSRLVCSALRLHLALVVHYVLSLLASGTAARWSLTI
jgi:hypothetical protein